MVKHRGHRFTSKKWLGKEYAWVHKMMDMPAKWLGPEHRSVWGHELVSNFFIGMAYGEWGAFLAALGHTGVDRVSTYLKRLRRTTSGFDRIVIDVILSYLEGAMVDEKEKKAG